MNSAGESAVTSLVTIFVGVLLIAPLAFWHRHKILKRRTNIKLSGRIVNVDSFSNGRGFRQELTVEFLDQKGLRRFERFPGIGSVFFCEGEEVTVIQKADGSFAYYSKRAEGVTRQLGIIALVLLFLFAFLSFLLNR